MPELSVQATSLLIIAAWILLPLLFILVASRGCPPAQKLGGGRRPARPHRSHYSRGA